MTASALAWWVAVFSLQIAVVIAAAAAGSAASRLGPASARFGYWRLVVVVALLLPLVPLVTQAPTGGVLVTTSLVSAATAGPAPAAGTVSPEIVAAALLLILGAGAVARLGWLMLGYRRLRRLDRASVPVSTNEFDDLRAAVAPHAQLCWQQGINQPATFGARRPVIWLPPALADLAPAARRAVVCHELIHAARGDWAFILVEQIVQSLFWFHPAMRWALARVDLEREQLVDATAIAITDAREPYLEALVHFTAAPATPAAALSFIRRRHLARRVRALVEEKPMPVRRTVLIGLGMCAVVIASVVLVARLLPLPVVSAQSAAGVNETGPQKWVVTARNPDYPAEAKGLGINADVSVGVTVAPSGQVVDAHGVSWGYHVQNDATQAQTAFLAAEPLNKRFVTAAENAVRSWTFETSDHEWKTGVSFEFRSAGTLESVMARSPNIKRQAPLQEKIQLSQGRVGASAGQPLQVGGAIKPPRILTRTKPVYTAEALKARIEGTVVLQITIDRDGHVADAKVMRSIPLLDQAAIDTVKQWTFEPTLLNGAPVDVSMYVTLNFRLS